MARATGRPPRRRVDCIWRPERSRAPRRPAGNRCGEIEAGTMPSTRPRRPTPRRPWRPRTAALPRRASILPRARRAPPTPARSLEATTPDADGCAVGCTVEMLAAPRPVAPLSPANVTSHTPVLRWALAPGTDGARIDVCGDRACTRPVASFSPRDSAAPPRRALARRLLLAARATAGTAVGTAPSPTWSSSSAPPMRR